MWNTFELNGIAADDGNGGGPREVPCVRLATSVDETPDGTGWGTIMDVGTSCRLVLSGLSLSDEETGGTAEDRCDIAAVEPVTGVDIVPADDGSAPELLGRSNMFNVTNTLYE